MYLVSLGDRQANVMLSLNTHIKSDLDKMQYSLRYYYILNTLIATIY